jgi:N-acetylglucosamine kinase-like BadF-type ATPase
MFHCGFWPDRTGGYDLATAALKAVYREALDQGPATSLTKRLCEEFDVGDGWELMHAFTRRGSALAFAGLERVTPVLLEEADGGDEIARRITDNCGRVLGEQGRVSAERVGLELDGALAVFTGGVLSHPSTRIVDAAMTRLPGAVAVRPSAPPIVGALALAFDQLGAAIDLADATHQIGRLTK